ncbi:MAG: TMEM165/GDT1 family protein [Candidatus Altiarchaeota archaeon]
MAFLEAFLTGFLVLGLAELGDKTQLAVLSLSTKHRPVGVFIGVMLAFFLVDGLAILVGGTVSQLIGESVIAIFSGGLFIFVGLYMLFSNEGKEERKVVDKNKGFMGSLSTSFLLVSAMELGDKTQIAAALLATQYDPLGVLAGTLFALALLTAFTIIVGRKITEKIPTRKINTAAATIFILIGIGTLAL